MPDEKAASMCDEACREEGHCSGYCAGDGDPVAAPGWRWLDGHALGPGLYHGKRRVIAVSVWLLRPRFMWRTRNVR